jgi:hypothetical protein
VIRKKRPPSRGASVYVLSYDVTRRRGRQALADWYQRIISDIERQVDEQELSGTTRRSSLH